MCKAFWKTVIGKSWVHQRVLLWVWGNPPILESSSASARDHERVERPAAGSSLDKWGGRESAVHYQVVQQAISHSPDHERLFRMDSQLVLNAVDSVPDGHGLVAPRLGDLGV